MQLEAHVLHHLARVEVLNLQHHRRIRRNHALGLGILVNHAADHHVDDVVLGAVLGDERADIAAVAHDGDAVGDHLDLIHAVRDVNDAQLLVAQIADDLEQLLDLRLGQCGRGLVEDDDLGLVGDGLGDLAHLLLADGQVAHLLGGIDLDAQLLEELLGLLVHLRVVNDATLHEFAADEDVLRNGQVVHHVQLLVNDDDARLLSLLGTMEFDFLAFIGDGSRILGVDAREHLHQRGLAGAVLAHQRMHFALANLQIDVIQRVHAREGFVNPFHRQNDFVRKLILCHSIPFLPFSFPRSVQRGWNASIRAATGQKSRLLSLNT